MKISSFANISALFVALVSVPVLTEVVQAQRTEDIVIAQRAIPDTEEFKGTRAPSIAEAGLLNAAGDHYFDVSVNAEPLNRVAVECVNFHELDDVKVLNAESGEAIPHQTDYGFETFNVTFEEPVPVGQTIRIVIEGSTVQGVTTGIIVPYRVFGNSNALGTIPLGTALVRGVTDD